MFEIITPEAAGVSSKHVAEYISYLNRRGAVMHSVLMMRHGKIFAEYYWAPFHKDFLHRMYSQTKSYVSLAIGLLIEEGKLSLSDKVYDYFNDGRVPEDAAPFLKEQTVRDMLMMTTAGAPPYWFNHSDPDRTHMYFAGNSKPYPAGTYWEYDSAGSQVLSSLVEKLSGMKLLDYLKLKLFNRMGTFQTATVLETRNGDSWGDSALCCTSRDMASGGYLVSHYGEFEGEQLMSADYLREATSKLTGNAENAFYSHYHHGYGYQIWRTEQNGFAFNGMGCQFTVGLPDRDFVFVCTADNQGYGNGASIIINGMFDYIVNHMSDEPLPEDAAAEAALKAETADLKLAAAIGDAHSDFAKEIDGVTYLCPENPTGITKFRFDFKDGEGVFSYTNAQGDKQIPFGLTTNAFGKFPELGYSNERGGMRTTDGFMYDCAASGAWLDARKFILRVQIIDRYFGNFHAIFGFNGDYAHVRMGKTTEDFLQTYQGTFTAKKQ
ncbi:MAG: serine hydrolase [Clostridia bacterium]|nr:serine hydrolase [Clostridia bacterium]